MTEGGVKVAVGRGAWHDEFAAALDRRIRDGAAVEYAIVDIDAHDWLERIAPYGLVIWKGRFMGPELAGYYKDKVHFIEKVLGKVIVPGFETVWHFESKVAQSYLFAHAGVATPETVATLDYDDALDCLRQARYPIVVKQSHGASSANVQLMTSESRAEKWLAKMFFQEMWERHKAAHGNRLFRVASAFWHGWFLAKVLQRSLRTERGAVAYWQEYVADNDADLRITVIGDRDAFGFWRRNRPGDFRASGSGLLDYEIPIPESAVRYCIGLNKRFGFDSMAYDLLFRGDDFVIVEMSYGYLDSAVFKAPGHFVLDEQSSLVYREGHVLPQDVWVEWALRKASLMRTLG
jgi:glutathione synthase/RimK-type ligase-like ATP-grasp enzyme